MTQAVDTAMRAYYRHRAPEYDEWYRRAGRFDRGSANARWHAELGQLTAWVDERRADRILEIACGTGWWTQHLARHGRVVAYDFSSEMLRCCAATLEDAGERGELTRGDAYRLPFAEKTFDAVFVGFWLSHVFPERRAEFVQETSRVLRPGGEVWVCDSRWAPDSGAVDHGPPPAEDTGGVHFRTLNDGSVHRVYKHCFSPGLVTDMLSAWGPNPVTAGSDRFFVWGRVRVGA